MIEYINNRYLQAIFFLFLLSFTPLSAQEGQNLSFISKNISQYQNRVLEINLRIKYYDRVFEKIVFYDAENIDIIFDISDRDLQKKLRNDLLNVHEGMLYKVKMKITGIGNLGGILAELIEFKPVIVNLIPQ